MERVESLEGINDFDMRHATHNIAIPHTPQHAPLMSPHFGGIVASSTSTPPPPPSSSSPNNHNSGHNALNGNGVNRVPSPSPIQPTSPSAPTSTGTAGGIAASAPSAGQHRSTPSTIQTNGGAVLLSHHHHNSSGHGSGHSEKMQQLRNLDAYAKPYVMLSPHHSHSIILSMSFVV
jgi:hypothetical protein